MNALEQAFLADIVEHPDDDAPRLVFADWLDDQGDSDRAAFIRLQVQRASSPGGVHEGRLISEETQLLARHENTWRAQLPTLQGVTWAKFSRGFIEEVFVESVAVLFEQAKRIFASAPICRLQIGELDSADARRLARWSYLTRLCELNLGYNPMLGQSGVQALADSPLVENLKALLLHNSGLQDRALEALANSTHLASMTELYLSGNDVGDAGVQLLARSRALPRLVELDLRDNQIGDAGARALGYYKQREQLTILWLVNNHIGPAGAWALAGTVYLPRLERLYLNYNPIGDDGAVAFATSPHRQALRELDLRHCGIYVHGAEALANSSHLESLQLLWLGGNRLPSETVARLRERFGERLRM
jgi:uncharacterized protein (TIGR02996 family)